MSDEAASTRFTKVRVGDGDDPEEFIDVGRVKDFDGPSSDAPEINVSTFDSEEAEYLIGLADAGQVQITGFFQSSDEGQQRLQELHSSGEVANFQLEYNDHASSPSTRDFRATVKSYKESGATNGAYEFQATLRVTGKVTRVNAPAET